MSVKTKASPIYHGDKNNVNFDYDGNYRYLNLPCEHVHRVSNIFYSNIEDENGVSIGYEGMRSFAITKSNLTNASLSYWLNQKSLYSPGLMKAAYGTFLTAYLVIWENDRVADEAASRFNVTWSRTAPVCVSLCNDYNCLYITGESDHRMGREAVGNVSNVWKFNFATSFSFSLIEQLVGNNVWNDTTIGSVTLGLLQSYLNNETLEIFASNGYIFLKILNDYTRLLFLDIESGVVRDEFSYYGLLGTMPCYHDGITERAWEYGSSLLNYGSDEFRNLTNIFSICIMSSVFINSLSSIPLEFAALTVPIDLIGILAIPVLIILFPDEANELWKELMYLLNPNLKDYPNITVYENMNYNPPMENVIIIPEDESLQDYIISEFKKNRDPKNPNYDKNSINNHINNYLIQREFQTKLGPIQGDDPNGTESYNPHREVGKYVRELYDDYNDAKRLGNGFQFVKAHLLELFALNTYVGTIDLIEFLINIFLFELSKDNSTGG